MRYSHLPENPSDARGDEEPGDLLSDPYTSHLLECLREERGETTLRDLSRLVAASVTNTSVDDIDAETRRQVEIFLHHGQLPKLSEHDVVRYDPEEGRVSLGRREIG